MITLEQARKIVEEGEALVSRLHDLDHNIAAFESVPGDTVQCVAFACAPGEVVGHRSHRMARTVELLPVPKSQAISALQRQRSKVTAKLAELGVEASPRRGYHQADTVLCTAPGVEAGVAVFGTGTNSNVITGVGFAPVDRLELGN